MHSTIKYYSVSLVVCVTLTTSPRMCPWKRDVDGLVPFWAVNPLPTLCRAEQICIKMTCLKWKRNEWPLSSSVFTVIKWYFLWSLRRTSQITSEQWAERSKRAWRTRPISDIHTQLELKYWDTGVNKGAKSRPSSQPHQSLHVLYSSQVSIQSGWITLFENSHSEPTSCSRTIVSEQMIQAGIFSFS